MKKGTTVDVTLQFEPAGAMPKLGGYCPQRVELGPDKPEEIGKLPEGLAGGAPAAQSPWHTRWL